MRFFSWRRGNSTADELPASSGSRQCGGRPLNLKFSTRPAQFYKFRSRIQRRHSLLIVVSARTSCVVANFHNFCQSFVKKRAEDCADRSAVTLCRCHGHRPIAGVDTGLSIACSGFIPQVENQNRDQVIFPSLFSSLPPRPYSFLPFLPFVLPHFIFFHYLPLLFLFLCFLSFPMRFILSFSRLFSPGH